MIFYGFSVGKAFFYRFPYEGKLYILIIKYIKGGGEFYSGTANVLDCSVSVGRNGSC